VLEAMKLTKRIKLTRGRVPPRGRWITISFYQNRLNRYMRNLLDNAELACGPIVFYTTPRI
jgi:hypothetical protein